MIFEVWKKFEVDTPSGALTLKEGQRIKLSKEEAIPLINEGRIQPYCIYLKALVDDCQWTCSEGEGMKTNHECPHFKTYLREKTGLREVMSQKYSELVEWLHNHDLTGDEIKEALPETYQDILSAIEKLDSAFINEDLTAFQDALDRVKRLYQGAMAALNGGKLSYRIYSEILQGHLWIAETDEEFIKDRQEEVIVPTLYYGEQYQGAICETCYKDLPQRVNASRLQKFGG